MKRKFKLLISLAFCFAIILITNSNTAYASSDKDVDGENLPKLKLSEVIRNKVKEAIITEFDLPEFYQPAIDENINNKSDDFIFFATKKKSTKKKQRKKHLKVNGYIYCSALCFL
ncbi:MAG: hypothetical protein PUG67_08820 [Peptoniphilaceae bacterium]|nr:hypothetical protein [Peptoniphilaceae bacterium]MDY6018343.1 hypothetical protein [Anaerococcus sp.]